jgi:hypothetical protein
VNMTRLREVLWTHGDAPLWAVVDGARDPRLSESLSLVLNPSACLFAGDLTEDLRRAAPYLVRLYPNDRFSDRLIERAWGQPWCLYVRSTASMAPLRKHLKSLLRVRDEGQRLLYFRFYDPRVLKIYLPTCTPEELALVFGPVVAEFVVEDAAHEVVHTFRLQDGALVATQTPVD